MQSAIFPAKQLSPTKFVTASRALGGAATQGAVDKDLAKTAPCNYEIATK
jgi:hypothetical protein